VDEQAVRAEDRKPVAAKKHRPLVKAKKTEARVVAPASAF
jgi:hypothetical protein